MENGVTRRPNAAQSAGELTSNFGLPTSNFAFTLIEVLVASAILAFLLVVFLSVASFSSQAWRGSQQKMEEFSTARIVMNRIRSDIESMVIRPDLPLFPNNEMGFMTAKRGNTNAARLLNYVEYGLNSSNQVVLKSKPYVLEDNPPFSTNQIIPAPATTTINVLASGVVGFQTSYLNKITETNGISSSVWSSEFNKYVFNTNSPTTNTVAVRVSLLVVSSEGLKHLQNTGKLSAVTGEMTYPTNSVNEKSPEEYWNSAIKVGGKIDIPTASSLRAFERVFFLPN